MSSGDSCHPAGGVNVHRRSSGGQEPRPGAGGQDALGKPPRLGQVERDGLDVLQARPAEAVLTHDVLVVTPGAAMGRAVVLPDHARHRVEQVGDPDQVAPQVEDRDVHQRRWQVRVPHPDDPQPHLVGRPAVLVGELERGTDLVDALPPAAGRDVSPHHRDRHELRGGDHVHGDGGFAYVGGLPHLVEQRPAEPCARDPLEHDDLLRVEPVAAEHDALALAQPCPRADRQGDRPAATSVGCEAVEVRRPVQPQRRPAGHRAFGGQPHRLLHGPLLGTVGVDAGRHVEGVRRLPPAGSARLPGRGAPSTGRVGAHRAHRSSGRWSNGLPGAGVARAHPSMVPATAAPRGVVHREGRAVNRAGAVVRPALPADSERVRRAARVRRTNLLRTRGWRGDDRMGGAGRTPARTARAQPRRRRLAWISTSCMSCSGAPCSS
jgi:hypothetical protein